jgi:uncharacterized membrane-anchored protein YitT (DUF2179 family)
MLMTNPQKEPGTGSRFIHAKKAYAVRVVFRRTLVDSFFRFSRVVSAGFGLKGFLLPNQFVDGGATGISLLINQTTGVSLSLLLILVNIPFMVLGFTQIGKSFGVKTVLPLCVWQLLLPLSPTCGYG